MPEDLLEQEVLTPDIEIKNTYLDRVNLVASGDPLDELLITYKEQIDRDQTPPLVQQKELIRHFRQGDTEAAQKLIEINRGFIAALAYPYRAVSFDNFEYLMSVSESALLEAAMGYDLREAKVGFTDFAAIIIDRALQKEFEWGKDDTYLGAESRPMLSVYRFMATLKKVDSVEDRDRKQYQDTERLQSELILSNADWLQYINLPNVEVQKKLDIDITTFYKKMKALMEQLHIPNRATLALVCMDEGIVFDVPPMPDSIEFSSFQLKVAPLMHHAYQDVADMLGVTFPAVNKATTTIKTKMKARSRTETVIMVRQNNVASVPDNTPEYLKMFTEFERELIPHLVLEDTREIMAITGLSKDGVAGGIGRMLVRAGFERRRQLALHLFRQGYEFDIKEPLNPLDQIVKTDKLFLLQNLDKTDDELVEMTGLKIHRIHYDISQAMKKTGARNRTELLLMAHKYGVGEFEQPPEKQTKLEKLATKLGLVAIDAEYVEGLLERIGRRERMLIRDYYFSDEEVTWRTVADEHGFGRTLSIATARNGVLRLKRMIDAQKSTQSS